MIINKKIICSPEHFTDLNITETKTKEEIFTHLTLGTENSYKYTTKTKGKTTSTT